MKKQATGSLLYIFSWELSLCNKVVNRTALVTSELKNIFRAILKCKLISEGDSLKCQFSTSLLNFFKRCVSQILIQCAIIIVKEQDGCLVYFHDQIYVIINKTH